MIKKRFFFYVFSTALVLFGASSLHIFNLNLGIDITGGQIIEIKTKLTTIDHILANLKIKAETLKTKETFIIRAKEIKPQILLKEIRKEDPRAIILKLDEISPSLSRELVKKAYLAIVFVLLGIGCYITFAFWGTKGLVSGFLFGSIAVLALFHDVIGTLGIFVLLSHFYNYELTINILIALLLVASFSTHDTIVVFDRLRENIKKSGKITEDIFDTSISQILIRSINISLTIILAILPLYFLINEIKPFVIVLITGVLIGTYSSLFLATPLIYDLTSKR